MKLSSKLGLIVGSSLLGMVVVGAYALNSLRETMIEERKAGVGMLVRLASNQVLYYQGLEKSGKLTREEAQKAAKDAMRALRDGDDFVFARGGEGLRLSVVHPDQRKEGKASDGGKTLDGRVVADAYGEETRKQKLAFIPLFTKRPTGDVDLPKINAAQRIPEWEWIVGSGVFVDDIDAAFWRYVTKFVLIGSVVLGGVIALALSLARGIYRSIGGEPAYAAELAKSIANGDLSQHLQSSRQGGSMLDAVAQMQQSLKQMIEQIKQGADTLSASSDALTEQMEQINVAAQHSAEATASTAASIEEMTVSVAQISDNADESRRNSERATQLADNGEKLVNQLTGELQEIARKVDGASSGIQELAERSREIDGIVQVIKEIADQTNLLALNAAIEAARAGEQGRGFAVVADEVRKLAERSSKATDEITAMIRAIQADTTGVVESMQAVKPQVARGVEVAEEAGHSLQEISQGAGKTLENIKEVALSTAEQRTASNSVASNVERISQMVEEMAAAVNSANDNVQTLEHLAGNLRSSVTRFRT